MLQASQHGLTADGCKHAVPLNMYSPTYCQLRSDLVPVARVLTQLTFGQPR